MELTISARPPFSLPSVVTSHGWVQLAPFDQTDEGFTYVNRLAGGRVIRLSVTAGPTGVRVSAPVDLDARREDRGRGPRRLGARPGAGPDTVLPVMRE